MNILLEIKKKIEAQNTWFSVNFDEEEEMLTIDTREHGDVLAEEFGEEDIIEGQRILKYIRDNFPDVKADLEPVDEWVIISVEMK